jgi:WD40 repeat protein
MSVSAEAPATPFKGLAAFQDTELDALLFYGREREREVVVANLLAARLTVLYGASGVGKTSLLRAAVVHSLRRAHDATVVPFSSWAGDPRQGLGDAIDAAAGIESEGTLSERLEGASRAVEGDVYVILDQFEEYFLYHEHDEFAGELAEVIREPTLRVNVLLGLREDALAKLDAFKGQIPNLFANYLRLDHLDRRGARAAILGPIERFNELTGEDVRVEPEVVETVLDQVAAGKVDVGRAGRGGVETDDERIEAPYLQLVLERLWDVERERGSTVLSLSTLRELGGAESIVRAHLERALARLEPPEQDVAATMFDHLVTPSGSKIAHRPGDLAQYAALSEAEVMPVLNLLGRERIVRAVDGAGGAERYEIFHDVLADGVLAWRARRELERDRETARKRQRRLVVVATAALLALAAMTAVAVYALVERSHARNAAREAHARTLQATALAELSSNPHRALADAVGAARLAPGARSEEVLRQALIADRLRRVLPAGGPVSVVAYDRGGSGRMLAAGADRHVRIYSAHGLLDRTLSLGGPVAAASFSPDGRLVLAAGGREAVLWSAATGARIRSLRLTRAATSAMFSPDGRLILTTSLGGATLWRIATGRRVALLQQRPVVAGTFSPGGRLVATLDASKPQPRVRVFDSSGRLLHLFAPDAELEGIAFSPDGSLLATASYKGTYLWDPRSGRRVRRRPLGDKPGLETDVEFSPDGHLLAVAEEDGAVRIWDVATGEREFFLAHHTNPIVAVAWSPDGRFLADASRDRTVDVYIVQKPTLALRLGSLVGHRSAVMAVAWSPDGRALLSGGADRTARLWDPRFEQTLRRIGAHRGGAVIASFDRSGRRVISAGIDRTARVWDVRTGRQLQSLRHKRAVYDAVFSANGRLVVTASRDGTAGIWDSATGVRLQTLQANAPVSVARFSPDGALVATGDRRGTVRLWRTRSGRLLATGRQRGPVSGAVFAPGGGTLATAGRDGVSVWSVPGGKRIRLLRSPGGVSAVAFSPDGSLLAAAGKDGAARIWDAATRSLRGVWQVSRAPLKDVVFSPHGRLLLATGPVVQTLDVRTGAPFRTLVGHTGPVSEGAFSPDGRWIVTAGPSSAGLWQRIGDRPYFYLKSAEAQPAGVHKRLTSVSFSPDGRLVLSTGVDGSVRLYRCEVCGNLHALLKLAEARLRSSA